MFSLCPNPCEVLRTSLYMLRSVTALKTGRAEIAQHLSTQALTKQAVLTPRMPDLQIKCAMKLFGRIKYLIIIDVSIFETQSQSQAAFHVFTPCNLFGNKLGRATCTDKEVPPQGGVSGRYMKRQLQSCRSVLRYMYQYQLCSIISSASHLCLQLHCGMLIRINFYWENRCSQRW